ncbi:hypothetical protein V496_03861 [Pseudogymnoascus sp. VKM F-4515 (FW-2607)]|nr:hypothetical protein V496_03861 [Pseudogymnoascus sp. VKM F-4515 (FW-2607)]KFY96482.1 hypothetical protein V498_02658 [Pseudogymnoascus sp. VKM F-4517 (FW-2822)]
MTRLSSVGNPSVYEAGDQRGPPTATEQRQHDVEEMRDSGHTSKMAAEHEHKTPQQRREAPHKREEEKQTEMLKKDPTLPAQMHNNEPSRGAKIDKELQKEDEEELKQKNKA